MGKAPWVAARAQRPKFGSPAPTWKLGMSVHSCNANAVEVGVEAGGSLGWLPAQPKIVNSRLSERQSGGKKVWCGRTRHMTSPSGVTPVHKETATHAPPAPDTQINLKQNITVSMPSTANYTVID